MRFVVKIKLQDGEVWGYSTYRRWKLKKGLGILEGRKVVITLDEGKVWDVEINEALGYTSQELQELFKHYFLNGTKAEKV